MLQTRSFKVCVLLIQKVTLWWIYWSQCLHVIRIHWSEFTKLAKCKTSLYELALQVLSIRMHMNASQSVQSVVWPSLFTLFFYFLTSTGISFRKCKSGYSLSNYFPFDCMLWPFWQACRLAGRNTWQVFLQEAIWVLRPTVSVQNTSVGSHGNRRWSVYGSQCAVQI